MASGITTSQTVCSTLQSLQIDWLFSQEKSIEGFWQDPQKGDNGRSRETSWGAFSVILIKGKCGLDQSARRGRRAVVRA